MLTKRLVIAVVLVVSLLTPLRLCAQQKQDKFSSNRAFGVFRGLCALSALTPDALEDVERRLKEQGFSLRDRTTWVLTDAQGAVWVRVFPATRACHLYFQPSSPLSVPESVLSTLISKGSAVLADGDTMEVALPGRSLSQAGHTGFESQWITFSLRGGLLISTAADITWNPPK